MTRPAVALPSTPVSRRERENSARTAGAQRHPGDSTRREMRERREGEERKEEEKGDSIEGWRRETLREWMRWRMERSERESMAVENFNQYDDAGDTRDYS